MANEIAVAKPRIRVLSDGTIPNQTALTSFFGRGTRSYDAGRRDSRETLGWHTTISTVDEEIISGRDAIVAKIRDLSRNNPAIAGGIDRACESVIGSKLRPEWQIDYDALGKNADWADDYAEMLENKWRGFSRDPMRRCDVERKLSIPHMFRLGYRHWFVDGEACAIVYDIVDRGKYKTCFRIIDPDRLTNPNGIADEMQLVNGNTIIGGVELGVNGDAVAYHISKKHPASRAPSSDQFTWIRIPRYGPTGRPQFIHAFRNERAFQHRGVSRFASAVIAAKQSDRYDKATLEKEMLRALNSMFIKSKYPTTDVRDALAPSDDATGGDWMSQYMDFRGKNMIRQEGVNTHVLFPEEDVEFPNPGGDGGSHESVSGRYDRKIAGSIGLSYPHYSQNWADINYSSGRLMRNEMWRSFMEDRDLFTQEFCSPFAEAWLEEAVAIGEVKIPGRAADSVARASMFYDLKPALCQVEWKGPGPGYGDPKKEAEANEIEIGQYTATHSSICDDKGVDPREMLRSAARDRKKFIQAGLVDPLDLRNVMGPGRPPENPQPGDGGDPVGANA
jgi:lambda family phage portal protein